MKPYILVFGVSALLASGASNADGLGIRAGLESPLYTHASQNGLSASYSLGDTFQPAINLLVEHYLTGFVGLGLEFREGFLATGSNPSPSNCVSSACQYQRTGTFLGPNLTLDLGLIFVRAAVPFHIEPSPFHVDLRAAGGLKFGVPFISFYAELLADFPLAGDGVNAFSTQQFGIAAGVWLKF